MEGMLSLAILALTAVALFFGAIFGLVRGRNRAILRLVLIILCIVASIALRSTVVEFLMNYNLGEGTVRDMLVETMVGTSSEMPAVLVDLIKKVKEVYLYSTCLNKVILVI